jgi:uncharacterized membrane protein YphA (DoxX/SURF4 family)
MTMVEMTQSTALLTREVEVRKPPAAVLLDQAVELNRRVAPTLLRLALAVVYVWFGALKFTGDSPVRNLIAHTLPFINPDISVPALGAVEIALGLVIALGRLSRITLLVVAGHLVGTFLTFVTAPAMMVGSNPLMLTNDGEFVVKNLVLISAALVLIALASPARHRR